MKMPTPNKGETKDDFVKRCVPVVVREGKDNKQAVAICTSIYENKEEKKSVSKGFKYFAPVTKAITSKDNQGISRRYMEVTVSGTNIDRDGDRMSDEAINKMIDKFNSGTMPFFYDHGLDKNIPMRTYRLKDIVGKWVGARKEENNLVATVMLNNANPDADTVWDYYQAGMPVAFSIGGNVVAKHEEELEIN